MELDIVMQINDKQKAELTKTRVFSNKDAMLQIKANNFDNALQILQESQPALFAAMNDFKKEDSEEPAQVDSMKVFLQSDAGQRIVKKFENAKKMARDKAPSLGMLDISYLFWKCTRGQFDAALIDAYSLGYKRGHTAKKK